MNIDQLMYLEELQKEAVAPFFDLRRSPVLNILKAEYANQLRGLRRAAGAGAGIAVGGIGGVMAIKAARKAMMNRRMAIAMAQRASRTRNAMIAAGGAGLLGVGAYMALRPRNAGLSTPYGYPLYKTSAVASTAAKSAKGIGFMAPLALGFSLGGGVRSLLRPMKAAERIKMRSLLGVKDLQIADLLKKINRYEMIGGMAGAGLGGAGLAALLSPRTQTKTAAAYDDPYAVQMTPQVNWKPFLPWIATGAAVGIGAGGLAKAIKAMRARSVAQELAMRRMKMMKQLGLLGAVTAGGLGAYALTNR